MEHEKISSISNSQN